MTAPGERPVPRDLAQTTTATPVFTVATLGFEERERSMLRDLLKLSEYTAPIFRTHNSKAERLPHIILVNGDQPEALGRLQAYRRANRARGTCSEIVMSSKPVAKPGKYSLNRPATVEDLFAMLEGAVSEDHGYVLDPSTQQPHLPFILSAEDSGATRIRAADAAAADVAVIPDAPSTAAQTAPVSAAASVARSTRVLVVDDSLPVRIQMKSALQPFADVIDFAESGEQALMLLDSSKYDLIFLDVMLPGKSGYDVCRVIRSHRLQKKTPVIMLTGNSSPADRVKGKLAGCNTYLIKPVRQAVLTAVIGDFIKSPAAA